MEIGKLSKEMQNKIIAAFKSDNEIDEQEARQLGLSKEAAAAINTALAEQLTNKKNEGVGDNIEIRKQEKDFTYTVILKKNSKEEGRLEWEGDSLLKIRTKYPEAHTPYLKSGVVTILDKHGKPVLDESGTPLRIDYIPSEKVFSEELAEINVLGHKANPMERILHQAELLIILI